MNFCGNMGSAKAKVHFQKGLKSFESCKFKGADTTQSNSYTAPFSNKVVSSLLSKVSNPLCHILKQLHQDTILLHE